MSVVAFRKSNGDVATLNVPMSAEAVKFQEAIAAICAELEAARIVISTATPFACLCDELCNDENGLYLTPGDCPKGQLATEIHCFRATWR